MTLRPLARLGATLVAAMLVATTAGTAQAATTTVNDRTGDVTRDGSAQTIPDVDHIDITSLKLSHTSNRITASFKVADLTTSDQLMLGARLVTNTGRDVMAIGTQTQGRSSRMLDLRNGQEPIRCNLTTNRNETTNVVNLFIPRSCVGNPNWVRFGGILVADWPAGGYIVDDARKNGAGSDTFKRIRLSSDQVAVN